MLKGENTITTLADTEPIASIRSPYHKHIGKPLSDLTEWIIKTAFQGRKERNESKLKSDRI